MENTYKLGIDIGSTTIKIVLYEKGKIIYKDYRRHFSDIEKCLKKAVKDLLDINNYRVQVMITGSGGMNLAENLKAGFVQEVVACTESVERYNPETDVVIELGGEDGKITFLGNTIDQRMNGACAGGTGAFLDQMASLLDITTSELNEYAKNSKVIYSIASRCGVFAKTDIQAYLNEGAKKEDISKSVFQAVVNQTISGLACGRKIRGNVAFLGGPLYFLDELRNTFIETLNLEDEQVVFPENSQYYVAMGAAILAEGKEVLLSDLYNRIKLSEENHEKTVGNLEPLFIGMEEYEEFLSEHESNAIKRKELSDTKGALFLGIDAGSTTTKAVLLNSDREIVKEFYRNNRGTPLVMAKEFLVEAYREMNEDAYIKSACVTGYGEGLIKKALHVDYGEVETIAHYKAGSFFLPELDFILDIGGQDMKAIKIKDGRIESILLNEACSSGCGSFLEAFAGSLEMNLGEFIEEAKFAKFPVDLGTRCTVFMNSKVKQAQKEGAGIGDISAGLAYSVIKNALYKVIKLKDENELGENIIVQGGTFYNDCVLRAFEKILGKEVVRPEITGLMGAFGCALIAMEKASENEKSKLLGLEEIETLEYDTKHTRCGGCTNNCLLTITIFNGKDRYISGNKCERPLGKKTAETSLPNLYKLKKDLMFSYRTQNEGIKIGIPRVLNMYENYPFWFTFFENLGFEVVLTSESTSETYIKGIDSIPSESLCYPAKLVNGHIMELINSGVENIFYPSLNHELKEDEICESNFNCPIVAGYPEIIKNNIEEIKDINFINPFIPYGDLKKTGEILHPYLKRFKIDRKSINRALKLAREEDFRIKHKIREEGEIALKEIRDRELPGIVLSGRPYHLDSEINHGIDNIITSLGMAVFTEDSLAHLGSLKKGDLEILNQWTYHSRLLRAAELASRERNLSIVQLNSFGCGIDGIIGDQVKDIIEDNRGIYTLIKIDEGSNMGAVRIRLRSLKAAIMENSDIDKKIVKAEGKRVAEFLPEMKKEYTILCPQMAPIHFDLLESVFKIEGYRLEVLPARDKECIDYGVKYVNNDACYPAIVVVGQVIKAVQSGKYDLDKLAVVISQTGGGCRASNYIALIRKALTLVGHPQIPVISMNTSGIEKNSGFRVTPKIMRGILFAAIYGDLLMRVSLRIRPYEKIKGSTQMLLDKWTKICQKSLLRIRKGEFKKVVRGIIAEFDNLEIAQERRPKVGIVGEILVKYHPTANNNIVEILENEGVEVVCPELFDFLLYCAFDQIYNYKYLNGKFKSMILSKLFIFYSENLRNIVRKELDKSKRFSSFPKFQQVADSAKGIVSYGNQTGEGWLLTAEMVDLIHSGVNNIVCMQPFACLPNHITGKGMGKELANRYGGNITFIDYDPGISEVNQINRIKLMLSRAFKNSKSELENKIEKRKLN